MNRSPVSDGGIERDIDLRLRSKLKEAIDEGDLSPEYDPDAEIPFDESEGFDNSVDDFDEDPDGSSNNSVDSFLDDRSFFEYIHREKMIFFGAVIFMILFSIIISATTDTPIMYVIIGLSPAIFAFLAGIYLLEEEFKDSVILFSGIIISLLFLPLGEFFNMVFKTSFDFFALTGINLLLVILVMGFSMLLSHFLAYLAESRRSAPVEPEDLEEAEPEELTSERFYQFVNSIEDKCKALNFVIGRVYRASNGGSKSLREKIKIPSDLYNQFNAIRPDELSDPEVREKAISLLESIEERLLNLLRPEKDVFSSSEVKGLKRLARDKNGKDRVIDVLIVNDEDPVQDYFLGAVDFCQLMIKKLRSL